MCGIGQDLNALSTVLTGSETFTNRELPYTMLEFERLKLSYSGDLCLFIAVFCMGLVPMVVLSVSTFDPSFITRPRRNIYQFRLFLREIKVQV